MLPHYAPDTPLMLPHMLDYAPLYFRRCLMPPLRAIFTPMRCTRCSFTPAIDAVIRHATFSRFQAAMMLMPIIAAAPLKSYILRDRCSLRAATFFFTFTPRLYAVLLHYFISLFRLSLPLPLAISHAIVFSLPLIFIRC